jgi:hypothetical protein
MADKNEGSLGTMREDGAAREVRASGETGGNVVAEFFDAARSAAESLLQEQKRQVAERVSGVADALHNAGESLDRSQNQVIARYVQQAAAQVETLSRTLRNRRWNELLVDTEDLARRQPTLFVLGAVATGFVLGRLMWTSTRWSASSQAPSRAETTRVVTAAVSSGSGAATAGTAETTAHGAATSGMGPR